MRSMHLVSLYGRKFVNMRQLCVPTFVDSAVFRASLLMNHHPGVAVGVVGGEEHCVNLASGQGAGL
jgi:hypothetical protein